MSSADLLGLVREAREDELVPLVAALAGALEVAKTRLAFPAPAQASDPDLTPDEAATALNVTRRAVYEFARRAVDPLPARRLGRRVRFPRRDLAAWQKRQGDVRG